MVPYSELEGLTRARFDEYRGNAPWRGRVRDELQDADRRVRDAGYRGADVAVSSARRSAASSSPGSCCSSQARASRRPPSARRPRSPCSAMKSASAPSRRARVRARGQVEPRAVGVERLHQLVDARHRRHRRNRHDRHPALAERAQRRVQVTARALGDLAEVGLGHHQHVRDLHDPGLQELEHVAGPGLDHDRHGVGRLGHLGLRLADADGLDHHHVERRGQRLRGGAGGGREAAEPLAGRRRADEQPAVAGVGVDPHAVAEQRAARALGGRVDGEHRDGAAVRAPGARERRQQRRLARARRAGHAHDVRARLDARRTSPAAPRSRRAAAVLQQVEGRRRRRRSPSRSRAPSSAPLTGRARRSAPGREGAARSRAASAAWPTSRAWRRGRGGRRGAAARGRTRVVAPCRRPATAATSSPVNRSLRDRALVQDPAAGQRQVRRTLPRSSTPRAGRPRRRPRDALRSSGCCRGRRRVPSSCRASSSNRLVREVVARVSRITSAPASRSRTTSSSAPVRATRAPSPRSARRARRRGRPLRPGRDRRTGAVRDDDHAVVPRTVVGRALVAELAERDAVAVDVDRVGGLVHAAAGRSPGRRDAGASRSGRSTGPLKRPLITACAGAAEAVGLLEDHGGRAHDGGEALARGGEHLRRAVEPALGLARRRRPEAVDQHRLATRTADHHAQPRRCEPPRPT